MEEKVTEWFRKRRYVGTKEFRNLLLAVLYFLEHGKAGLYQRLCEITGDSYEAVSHSMGEGARKIWQEEEMFSQDDEKPKPMYILEELAEKIKKECGLK